MNIFGIGPMEIALILILVLIFFNPKDLSKTSKSIGKSLNKLVRSDTWKSINQTSNELKNLPNRLMREAGMDEIEKMTGEGLNPIDNTVRPQANLNPMGDTSPTGNGVAENHPQPDPLTSQKTIQGQSSQTNPIKPLNEDSQTKKP